MAKIFEYGEPKYTLEMLKQIQIGDIIRFDQLTPLDNPEQSEIVTSIVRTKDEFWITTDQEKYYAIVKLVKGFAIL